MRLEITTDFTHEPKSSGGSKTERSTCCQLWWRQRCCDNYYTALPIPYLSFPAAILLSGKSGLSGQSQPFEGKDRLAVVASDSRLAAGGAARTSLAVGIGRTARPCTRLQRVKFSPSLANLVTTGYCIGQSGSQSGLTQIKVVGETPYTPPAWYRGSS